MFSTRRPRWPDVLLPVVRGDVERELVHESELPGTAEAMTVTYGPDGITVTGGVLTELEWALFLVGVLDGDFDLVKLKEEWKAKQGIDR